MKKETGKKERLLVILEQITKEFRKMAEDIQVAIDNLPQELDEKEVAAQMALLEDTEAKMNFYKKVLANVINQQWAAKRQRRGSVRKAPEDRHFVKASTSDEAEGYIPSIEERILMLNGMTREDTFKQGNLTEMIRAFLCCKDDANYIGGETKLTLKEEERIKNSIQTPEAANKVQGYLREFDRLCNCGEQLSYYFKRFQAFFSPLAQLLSRWDYLEEKAQLYTESLTKLQNIPIAGEEQAEKRVLICFPSKEAKENAIERDIKFYQNIENVDGKFEYDRTKNIIFANIYTQGGLYEKILQAARDAEDAMSDFNAIAFAAEEAINKSELHYIPISIQVAIENAKTERYTRYLVKNLSYFRSEYLRKRKEAGKPLTLGEERRALIPDYYETKPNRALYRDARAALIK